MKKGLIANFIGRIWATLSTLICVPFYVKLLGMESYGLVGFYASTLSVLVVSDIGLTPTLKRELARLSPLPGQAHEMRDTTRTIELLHWGIMALLALLVYCLAPVIGQDWLQARSLSARELQNVVRLMGLAFALQMVFNLYQSGMIGLQQQVRLNVIQVVGGIFRSVGVIGALLWIAPTVQVFFIWQVLSFGLLVLWSRFEVWRCIPLFASKPEFRMSVLRMVWRYAIGMLGMNVTSTLLMQTDKVVLSRLLPLDVFGYYTLAWTVAQAPIQVLTNPVQQVVFPRLTAYATRREEGSVAPLYHQACELIGVLIWPTAWIMGVFAPELLWVWVGDFNIAAQTQSLLRLLVPGSSFQGIMVLPFALQQAYGWTSLGLAINAVSVLCIIPVMLLLVTRYGAAGAGVTWLILNTATMLVANGVMHRRVLVGQQWRWYSRAVVAPAVAAAVPVLLSRLLIPSGLGRVTLLLVIGSFWVLSVMVTAMTSGTIRSHVLSKFRRHAEFIQP